MEIFTVHGSSDKNGNSRALVDRVLQAAGEQGAETELVHIYDYTVTDVWLDYLGDALQNDFSKAGDDEKQKTLYQDWLAD
jgi:multimeric flavodoxin WrbA